MTSSLLILGILSFSLKLSLINLNKGQLIQSTLRTRRKVGQMEELIQYLLISLTFRTEEILTSILMEI
jgi:hypothetical protein